MDADSDVDPNADVELPVRNGNGGRSPFLDFRVAGISFRGNMFYPNRKNKLITLNLDFN